MRKIVIVLVLACLVCFSGTAQAHERRLVNGKFEFVVGFLNEPAFSGEMNGVDLRVAATGWFAQPLIGVEEVLVVRVTFEGSSQSLDLPLRKRYKEPGKYAAHFLPAEPGRYVFHFTGTINGMPVDETFMSGEKFHDVEDRELLRFPKP